MTSTVIPFLRYHDAPAAIEWLCRVPGFSEHLVVTGEDGTVHNDQLVNGAGMIMLGSSGEGVPQAGAYIVVEDADRHHERAAAEGAEIVSAPQDQPYGGRLHTCRDPEGVLWHIGSYDPWSPPDNGTRVVGRVARC